MYQPKETMRGGSTPPNTGSSTIQQPKRYTIKIEVDTTNLDTALDKFREMERIYDKVHNA